MVVTPHPGASTRPQKTLLHRLQEQSRPAASTAAGALQIAVVAGRHKGARSDAADGATIIGSSLDCDVVLTDAGVQARHVTLEANGRGRNRTVTVTAHAPGVIIAGEEIAVGTSSTSGLPLTIDIGPARVDVSGVSGGMTERSLNMWLALPLAVAAGAGIGMLLTWGTGSAVPSAGTIPTLRPSVAAPSTSPSVAVGDVQALMRRQLAATGLDKHVKITQRDNIILAEGNLPLEAYPAWRQVKAAITASTKERILIADTTKPIEAGEGPRGLIAAVTLGKTPAVIGTNGRRAGIGDMLADGWIVRQINADDVQLERGGNRVTIKLSP